MTPVKTVTEFNLREIKSCPICGTEIVATADGIQPKKVGCIDGLDVLQWIKETAGKSLKPCEAWTSEHDQVTGWMCHGCDGEFLSKWPKWTEPTDSTFPHKPDCMYLKAMRLLASASNGADKRRGEL